MRKKRQIASALYNRRMSETIVVTVAKDLEDLVPIFMKNRVKELETLRSALAGGDFEQMRQLGHRMKGVGNSYGFEKVSQLGKHIEDAAKTGDRAALEASIADYADYLPRVTVVYE
jgi:HPt (histidine-containing phosphotransfer) domain-containing protein